MWSFWPLLSTAAALQSIGISLWQHRLAMQFPLHREPRPLPPDHSWPSLTLLKPLKGCDSETRRNLESWLNQDYPGEVQILFGIASSQDPVFQLASELAASHPTQNIRVVVCPPSEASNPKVSTLMQLQPLVEHTVVVVSDADVRAHPSLLRHLACTLAEPGVGLAHCLYRLANPSTPAMRLEALGVNGHRWSRLAPLECSISRWGQ